MSRIQAGSDQILVKPTNNVYTVLVAVGVIIQIMAFIMLWMVHQELFATGLFSG